MTDDFLNITLDPKICGRFSVGMVEPPCRRENLGLNRSTPYRGAVRWNHWYARFQRFRGLQVMGFDYVEHGSPSTDIYIYHFGEVVCADVFMRWFSRGGEEFRVRQQRRSVSHRPHTEGGESRPVCRDKQVSLVVRTCV